MKLKENMIPLFKPYMPDIPHIVSILKSGKISYGNYGRLFEKELSKFINTNKIITTNSFNTALLVALQSMGIGIGDEVILSPMSCLVSTQPLLAAGLKVRWADIDPNTGTLSPESVKKRLTKNTKAIIHNHYCGYVGYIDEINEIARNNGVLVIDDCIEAFGAEYKGNKIGNVGTDATVFSFGAVRIPNTIEGGAVVFKNSEFYEKSKLIRDCGIDRSKFRDELGEISKDCDITMIGYSAMLSDVNSYIGIEQMKVVPKLLSKQRENAKWWEDYLTENFNNIKIINRKEINPNYWVYGFLTENKKEVIKKFRKEGFYASSVHLNNNCYSVFGDKKELKGVNEFYNRFIALPCGWWFND